METIVILVCYNGKWVISKKMCKYEEGDSKGVIVPRTSTFAELLDRVHHISNTNSREDKVCLKFSVLVASNEWKHIKIELQGIPPPKQLSSIGHLMDNLGVERGKRMRFCGVMFL
ncbi:hypothetical protein L3X38_027037 [Prunus dulcis]|uniref:NB-ARC domain-containing disease resistance protein n=1 Tax=Prunus dulcis TaxID=3755 RepID=A0AAD4VN24_PRUDU|nr:hypothetical protein L3X38_027037 [Prunus dulcis]